MEDKRTRILLGICIGAGILFLALLLHAKLAPNLSEARSPLTQLDIAVSAFAQEHDGWRPFWTIITWLGSTAFLLAIVLGALLALRDNRQRLLVLSTALLAFLLQYTIKLLIASPRPLGALEQTYAFPSGHTLGATAVYGVLLYFAYVSFRQAPSTRLWPALLVYPSLILLVGVSRIAIGAHWATDVLGGLSLGACIVSGVALIERSRKPRPPTTGEQRSVIRRPAPRAKGAGTSRRPR